MKIKRWKKKKKINAMILSSFLIIAMLISNLTFFNNAVYADEIAPHDDLIESTKNHALGKNVEVNNHEGTTIGANAVDGKLDTHWGTEPRSTFSDNPEMVIDLEQLTKVKSFLINWERQSAAQNIIAYEILYSEDKNVWHSAFRQTEKVMQQSHTINLDNQVDARYIKLIVTKYDGGTLNYHNVGIKEF